MNILYISNKNIQSIIPRDVHKISKRIKLPGSFFGFLRGTNFAPIANAIGGPKTKPRASIPGINKKRNIIFQNITQVWQIVMLIQNSRLQRIQH